MTEITKIKPSLTPIQRRYILHWGEMGTRWGINRTVAQVHALLYLSPAPLNAEQIAAALSVARSNVSVGAPGGSLSDAASIPAASTTLTCRQ
jgi:hypothetical protein